ncbi:MAG: hypothetical protein D3909_11280 [Candidatus Electrothrix sp. ATG1]|nr:hypothetical protein [Candidatus Electrothrix sp. ATG1]
MTLLCKQKRTVLGLLVFGVAALFLQGSQGATWAGLPVQAPEEAASTAEPVISLNRQEKQRIHEKEVIVRERPTRGKPGKIFEAVGIIEAERERIQEIVQDYQSYPDFMPNVSRIEILEQDKSTTLLNQFLSLPMGKSKKYRISMKASEPDEGTTLIQWQLRPWPGLKPEETIKDTSGFWRIEELAEKRSLVLYHVYTDPGKIPFGLGWIVDLLSKDSVPEVLTKTKERAEKNNR